MSDANGVPLWRRPIEVELFESFDDEKPVYTLTFRQPTVAETVEARELDDNSEGMSEVALAEARLKLCRKCCEKEPGGFFDSGASLLASTKIWEAVFFRTGWTLALGKPGLERLGARLEGSERNADGRGEAARGDRQEVQGLQDNVRGAQIPTGDERAGVSGVSETRRAGTGDGGTDGTADSD